MFFFRKKCKEPQEQKKWNGKERRQFARRIFPCKLFVCTDNGKIFSAYTQDMSEEGLQIVIEENIPVDTVVRVELYIDDEPIICEGRVAWIRENAGSGGGKTYNAGIEIKSRHIF